MYSMSILVALTIPSFIANSLTSGVVVQLAGALEDNICYSSLSKYIVETACMFPGSVVLTSITTMRVEGKKRSLKIQMIKKLQI